MKTTQLQKVVPTKTNSTFIMGRSYSSLIANFTRGRSHSPDHTLHLIANKGHTFIRKVEDANGTGNWQAHFLLPGKWAQWIYKQQIGLFWFHLHWLGWYQKKLHRRCRWSFLGLHIWCITTQMRVSNLQYSHSGITGVDVIWCVCL